MRSSLAAAAAALLLLSGCLARPAPQAGAQLHPHPIVVAEFAFSPGVVTLDPSFGFSLHRGSPGVPPQRRAESVGRAAAFSLADAIAEQLTSRGYDTLHVAAGTAAAAPDGQALIVSGDFRRIYEGHRRQEAGVAVEVAVSYQGPGAAPRRLTAFALDSRRLPREPYMPAAGRRGHDVNYEATRLGAAIGRYVADLARINRWPRGTAAR